jgi:hypothetical protein
MSLDLIKKQKANIQKERKRITDSDEFQHPLAYQPMAKGRKDAIKEELGKTQEKSALDSFYRMKNQSPKSIRAKTDPAEKFKITPDRNAANLFLSNIRAFVPGKKGSHVSDVFAPNKPGLGGRRKKTDTNFTGYPEPDQSYAGYHGKTKLMLKINADATNYSGKEGEELIDRLGDLDMDLPRYAESDIYNYEELKKNTGDGTGQQSQKIRITTESHGKTAQNPKYKPDTRYSRSGTKNKNGTIVKFSFTRPDVNVKLAVTPQLALETLPIEEEEEEEIKEKGPLDIELAWTQPPSAPQKIVATRPKKILPMREIAPQSPYTADLSNQPGRNIPIANVVNDPVEEEEEAIHLTRDYRPASNYSLPPRIKQFAPQKKKREYLPKIKKTLENLKKRALAVKKPNKIIAFKYHSGKTPAKPKHQAPIKEYEPLESDFPPPKIESYKKPHSAWSEKFLTRREEKIIENSLNLSKNFKSRFFTLRSEGAKRSAAILGVGIIVALTIPMGAYVQKIIEAKNRIETKSDDALNQVQSAKTAMLSAKPEEAQKNFASAYQDFLSASDSLDEVGGSMLSIIKVLPGGSKIESGQNLIEAGKHLTAAGQIISEAFTLFLGDQGALKNKLFSTTNLSSLQNITAYAPLEKQDKAESLTQAIIIFQQKLDRTKNELAAANDFLGKVDLKDLPEDKRDSFSKLKGQLPEAVESINSFSGYSNIILNILGHNQPKQYLFLFENNDEIRATGGFIGTYGIVKIDEGKISQLTIDGIYNPDGQLKERVIPPKPIQKMSATWSMHDANWWPDFPKSAEKVAWFYQKTGGPTVDGVFAITPKIMEDFLQITGPITLDQYGVTVNADNFVEVTQYKVEKDYDKQLNRPKQILADLAPVVLEKIMSAPPEKWVEVLNVFSDNLERREIQAYFFDSNIQKEVSRLGWSGEILQTPKDYLAVINTNISGLKTDKVIEQKIDHQAEIKPDGSIVDTVTLTRTHNGGHEKYDYYNAVNSDWLRVYVPKGSELLRAEGYTREVDSPPVDYQKLGFVQDEMVANEENSTNMDQYTGTRVYEDSGKTVFANWTYVSPGETLTVKYSYLLPFKLRFDDLKKPADTYSLLMQKQAGDENSTYSSAVNGLNEFDTIYHYPDSLMLPEWKVEDKFTKDFFAGAVLVPKGTKIE